MKTLGERQSSPTRVVSYLSLEDISTTRMFLWACAGLDLLTLWQAADMGNELVYAWFSTEAHDGEEDIDRQHDAP